MTLALLWFAIDAHKWFKGPKVNIEHMMLGREEAVINGEGHDSGESSANSLSDAEKGTASA